MDKIAKELIDIARSLTASDDKPRSAAKDPWKARREVSERVEKLGRRIEDIWISEDAYNFGDYGPAYKRNVNSGFKQLDALVTKMEAAANKIIDKIEG